MRVGFLVVDPGQQPVIQAVRAAGIDIVAVVTPETARTDQEAARALAEAKIEVLVALGGRPPPGSPLRSARWTLLSSHRSLLPRHRGWDPVWHTLAEGDAQAGVSVYVVDRIRGDAGPILHQEALDVDPAETFATLAARLAALEPGVVVQALRRFQAGATYADQDEAQATSHPAPLTAADTELDPARPLAELVDRILAGSGAPVPAWFHWRGHRLTLLAERIPNE